MIENEDGGKRLEARLKTIDDLKTVSNDNGIPNTMTTSDCSQVARKLTRVLDVYNSRWCSRSRQRQNVKVGTRGEEVPF